MVSISWRRGEGRNTCLYFSPDMANVLSAWNDFHLLKAEQPGSCRLHDSGFRVRSTRLFGEFEIWQTRESENKRTWHFPPNPPDLLPMQPRSLSTIHAHKQVNPLHKSGQKRERQLTSFLAHTNSSLSPLAVLLILRYEDRSVDAVWSEVWISCCTAWYGSIDMILTLYPARTRLMWS